MREDIAEVCVLGVPDDYWGESVQAVVVLRPGSKLTPEECALIAASLPNPRKFNSSRPGNYMLKKTKEDPLSYEMRPYISTPTRYTFYGFKEEKEITRTPVWAFLFLEYSKRVCESRITFFMTDEA